jgi:hypothetical protein
MIGMYVTRPRDTSSPLDLGGSALPAGAPGTGGSSTGENLGAAGAAPSGPGWVRDHCAAVAAAREAAALVADGVGGEGGGPCGFGGPATGAATAPTAGASGAGGGATASVLCAGVVEMAPPGWAVADGAPADCAGATGVRG